MQFAPKSIPHNTRVKTWRYYSAGKAFSVDVSAKYVITKSPGS